MLTWRWQVQVAVRLADLEEAGPGSHRCKMTVLEGSRSSTSVPASEPHPSITDGALPSPTPELPSSPRSLGASRKAGRRRIVGTLEFVFQMLVDKRGTGAGAPSANGAPGAKAAAHTVTGFPSLDDGAESSGAALPAACMDHVNHGDPAGGSQATTGFSQPHRRRARATRG